MYKAQITISLRPSILDTQGKAVQNALHQLGLHATESVRIGKHVELQLDTDNAEEATVQVREACEKLLVNAVMEDYVFTLDPV